jgi:hypothetical protein
MGFAVSGDYLFQALLLVMFCDSRAQSRLYRRIGFMHFHGGQRLGE